MEARILEARILENFSAALIQSSGVKYRIIMKLRV